MCSTTQSTVLQNTVERIVEHMAIYLFQCQQSKFIRLYCLYVFYVSFARLSCTYVFSICVSCMYFVYVYFRYVLYTDVQLRYMDVYDEPRNTISVDYGLQSEHHYVYSLEIS